MIHFCIFGGRAGQLGPGRNIHLTLFGGSEFKRPATARRLAAVPHEPNDERPFHFFFTAFGSTEIKWPTLAELHHRLFASAPGGMHAADSDVRACARCFFELKRRNLIRLPET